MKPSFTTTISREPQGELEGVALGELLGAVSASFQAHKLGLRDVPSPIGLEQLITGEKSDRIAKEVAGCSRMVSFVSFHGNHASVEISFSEGRKVVQKIMVSYDYVSRRLYLSGEQTW